MSACPMLARSLTVGLTCALLPAAPIAAQTSAAAAWQATPASVLKNALRAVTAAEARYHAQHGSYSNSLDRLDLHPGPEIRVEIPFATAKGWHAKATHRAQPGRSCVVFAGDLAGAEAPRTEADGEMAGEEGVPLCDRMR